LDPYAQEKKKERIDELKQLNLEKEFKDVTFVPVVNKKKNQQMLNE
jgi:hypothetical protein